MIGIRQLLVLAVVVAAVWLYLRLRARWRARPRPGKFVATVRCRHCGVHLPRAEAVGDATAGWYCSRRHQALGPGADAR